MQESTANDTLRRKLVDAAARNGLDAVLAVGVDNFSYVTQLALPYAQNYPDRIATSLTTQHGPGVVTCPYEWSEFIRDQGWTGDIISYQDGLPFKGLLGALTRTVETLGLGEAIIGYDVERVPKALLDALLNRFPDVRWEPCDGMLRALRLVKTPGEITLLEKAVRVGQQTMVAVINHTEGTVDAVSYSIAELTERLRVHIGEFGGSAAGHIAAAQGIDAQRYYVRPHGKLSPGKMLRLNISNQYRGYWSQAGRTMVVGEASDAQLVAYQNNNVLKAAAVLALRPGVTCQAVFKSVLREAEREGIAFWKETGIGHGIGTSEREAPFLNEFDTTVLAPGMVLVIDVPSYGPEGEVISSADTYLITDDGNHLLSWYRNWDRLPCLVGVSARHG